MSAIESSRIESSPIESSPIESSPIESSPIECAAVAPIGIDNAEHYRWGQVCDGWHLLKLDEFSVIRERVPPGAAEVRHRHARARQFFYVLEGAAVIEVDGVRHILKTGQGLHIPPGAAHQFRNESRVDVHFLVVSVPKSHGDRENVEDAGAAA